MIESGIKSNKCGLSDIGITQVTEAHWNLSPSELTEIALQNREGQLTDTGALMCDTGKFTGRSPKDRYIVQDGLTKSAVWWGEINIPMDSEKFDLLYAKMIGFLAGKKVFVRDAYAGADKTHRIDLRVINTLAWHNLFCYNMFIEPEEYKLETFVPNFTIINCPEFEANPETDGTRAKNFAVINLTKRIILIGGTGYSGEMKKGIFSVLNFLLPLEDGVLPMHCSANMGIEERDTAIFFGLSGTGKTTLSADPNRILIGDDEHGWTSENVFNFEGGCYAKTIGLSEENEPDIYRAIKFGAILENTRFYPDKREVNYENVEVTENTRVSYPISHISNSIEPSIGGIPRNIFFLTCDAFGVMPPIQRLSTDQAMYHFISGYTSKVAGTEEGVTEPMPVFSACFGAPFMPLHPSEYAKLLGKKLEENSTNVWLINTGWTGGAYGVGSRIKLKYTRAMISAALSGVLDNVGFRTHSMFGGQIPTTCPGVPNEILSPRETWKNDEAFYKTANELVLKFQKNFDQFRDRAEESILSGEPKTNSMCN
ncbi:phosphoenolpyruvate carboxykinase (ATP) [Reichenbachiella faecimaris]|uniref:Phosphoenolpyruvate carboxykinase (ATP) n=1 Tax=Reichenbachiella faecimaris TaxID=692418 RepID=A0A1W2GI58_REIFA|nr:phosphoenolpyruvate carboxykinase (ATP) [Reichenbachiella faecimaris]SMD35966.1 phosphoenolpyruvate carboxykinase (ATP) [Reichenbachiella faecimaris]